MSDHLACRGCGGPHRFDTSVPSPLWNRVIRAAGLPEFLCASCIVEAFVKAREGFSAELYGKTVNMEHFVPTIHVQVGERPIEDSYGDLHTQLAAREGQLAALVSAAQCFEGIGHVAGCSRGDAMSECSNDTRSVPHTPCNHPPCDCGWDTLDDAIDNGAATSQAHDAALRAATWKKAMDVAVQILEADRPDGKLILSSFGEGYVKRLDELLAALRALAEKGPSE